MTVGELLHALTGLDRDRMVYVPDTDGRAEMVAGIVNLRHTEVLPGIRIPDDVALLPASMLPTDEEELTDGN